LATIPAQGSISTILPSEDSAEIWPDIHIFRPSNGEAPVYADFYLHFSLSDAPQNHFTQDTIYQLACTICTRMARLRHDGQHARARRLYVGLTAVPSVVQIMVQYGCGPYRMRTVYVFTILVCNGTVTAADGRLTGFYGSTGRIFIQDIVHVGKLCRLEVICDKGTNITGEH
jgi:hypothetical protein